MGLEKSLLLRRLVLPIFRRFNPGDITIRHHWTGDRIRLHSFRHKGYWYFGKRRELQTIRTCQRLISPGDQVLDIGGHIGYFSLLFSQIVGPTGHVYVFEPGPNNLPYTRVNLAGKENITLVEKGVGSSAGQLNLYVENLTGQNNSFVRNYMDLFPKDQTHFTKTSVESVQVDVVTLDSFVAERGLHPRFIKVDVEGFELEVLQGAGEVLKANRPVLMIEVQLNHAEIVDLLHNHGYCICLPSGEIMESAEKLGTSLQNVFCFHSIEHSALLEDLAGRATTGIAG